MKALHKYYSKSKYVENYTHVCNCHIQVNRVTVSGPRPTCTYTGVDGGHFLPNNGSHDSGETQTVANVNEAPYVM